MIIIFVFPSLIQRYYYADQPSHLSLVDIDVILYCLTILQLGIYDIARFGFSHLDACRISLLYSWLIYIRIHITYKHTIYTIQIHIFNGIIIISLRVNFPFPISSVPSLYIYRCTYYRHVEQPCIHSIRNHHRNQHRHLSDIIVIEIIVFYHQHQHHRNHRLHRTLARHQIVDRPIYTRIHNVSIIQLTCRRDV